MWPVELEAEKIAELKARQTKKSAEQTSTIELKIDAAKGKVREKEDELAARVRSVAPVHDVYDSCLSQSSASRTVVKIRAWRAANSPSVA
jgi:hypothetical protein